MQADIGRRPAVRRCYYTTAQPYTEKKPIPEDDGDDKRHAATAHYVTGDCMLGAELTHPPQHPKPQKPHYLDESG